MINVLIIDDSYYIGTSLTHILESDKMIRVVAVAGNCEDALQKIEDHNPDVILLNIDMPGKEGPDVLTHLMGTHLVPVIILSRVGEAETRLAIRYLEKGAVDFITKPRAITYYDTDLIKNELIDKVKRASTINIQKPATPPFSGTTLQHSERTITKKEIIIMGASTGGPRAIETILAGFRRDIPLSVIIVQHMGKALIPTFAERLRWVSNLDVTVAINNEVLIPGMVILTPGGCNTIIVRDGDKKRLAIAGKSKHPDDYPSIDTTMKSAANVYQEGVIGVLLTGIGNDGVKGLKAIKEAGGCTIVEEQSTCMVYGMPKAAVEAGVADEVVSLPFIAEAIIKKLTPKGV